MLRIPLQDAEITDLIIASAIEVHKSLGPGLLESVYELCLCRELSLRNVQYERQVSIPIEYKGVELDGGFRMDLVVEKKVIVELKSVDSVTPLHEAQLLTYLRLTGYRTGLLLNFNVRVLRDGITRRVI